MNLCHLIKAPLARHTLLDDCKAALQVGDIFVFCGMGVMWLTHENNQMEKCLTLCDHGSLYALQTDIKTHLLTAPISPHIHIINDEEFIQLTQIYYPIITWS